MDRQETRSASDMIDAPEALIDLTQNEYFSIPLVEQQAIQLAAARKRFAELVPKIPVLTQLAEEQGVTEIRELEDLAPLLLPHSALKSYPLSFLENSRFDRLTQWLNGFTTYDLSKVDATDCDSIDDWLQLLDRETDVRVLHSSGTTGKLSFLPRGVPEMHAMTKGYIRWWDSFGDDPSYLGVAPEQAPIIFPQYRDGGMAHHRHMKFLERDLFGGDAGMIVTLYPGRFSADAASIGGRLRAAETRGELGSVSISPKLLKRRDDFIQEQEQSGAYMDAFFDKLASLRGRTVVVMGHAQLLFTLALEAEKRGVEDLFTPSSCVALGGGMKGFTLPDDWQARVKKMLGGAPLVTGYGMTEVVGTSRTCSGGHYHVPIWQVPFLLDPSTGELLPRTGVQKGRYGVYDLVAQTYWGGILTGDEVTVSFGDTETCSCGRIGPFLHNSVRRLAEKEGGDDKITCAGAPEAHDKAIDFILASIGG